MPTENVQSITLQIQLEGNAEENQKQEQKSREEMDEFLKKLMEFLFGKGKEQDKEQSNNVEVRVANRNGELMSMQEYVQLMKTVDGAQQQVNTLAQKGLFDLISDNQSLFNEIAKDAGNKKIVVNLKEITKDGKTSYEIANITVDGKEIDLKSEKYKDFLKPSRDNINKKEPTQEKTPEVTTPQQGKNKKRQNSINNSNDKKLNQKQQSSTNPLKNMSMKNTNSISNSSTTPGVNRGNTKGRG